MPIHYTTRVGICMRLTADGKGMQVTNFAPGRKCWTCRGDVGGPLVPQRTDTAAGRFGAFLWPVPLDRSIGDYAHAVARIGTAVFKRLETLAQAEGRSTRAYFLALRRHLSQEAQGVPAADRLVQRMVAPHKLDLTQGRLLASS